MELHPSLFCLFFCLLYFFLPPFKELGCFSGCLMSSAGIQKLFCGIYSVFKCSFDEFVGEKVFSPSYSSTILAPLKVSFKPAFHSLLSPSSRDFFSSSSLSAIRVVSSAYLRLLIFLPEILIPICVSSSPAFHMMYSA